MPFSTRKTRNVLISNTRTVAFEWRSKQERNNNGIREHEDREAFYIIHRLDREGDDLPIALGTSCIGISQSKLSPPRVDNCCRLLIGDGWHHVGTSRG